MTGIRGIDVSCWQGTIDWEKVAKDDVTFAMIRAGYGTSTDRLFRENLKNAQQNGVSCGVYIYSLADSVAKAKEEAHYLIDTLKGQPLELPVAFDIEDTAQLHLSNSDRTDLIEAFCMVIAEAGYKTMVYTSSSWFDSMFEQHRIAAFEKWVARWSATAPDCKNMKMWQFTNKGQVDGIESDVDLNWLFEADDTAAPPSTLTMGEVKAGVQIFLENAPLYNNAYALAETRCITGKYWLYDDALINNRIRITNRAEFVKGKPAAKYVTGFVSLNCAKKMQ